MARRASAQSVRWWAAASLLAVIAFSVPMPPWVVEQFYSRDAYPWLQAGLTTATNLVPFAVLDVQIGLVLTVALYRLTRLVVVARSRGLFDAVSEATRRLLRGVAAVALAFMTVWGCNYRRSPLEVEGAVSSVLATEALRDVIHAVGGFAGNLRTRPDFDLELEWNEAALHLEAPMTQALQMVGHGPLPSRARPKTSLLLAPWYRVAGIDGMINPLGLETIVQDDLLPVERGFVLARAWAHLAGYADDDEARAIGWLACMKGDPALAYSASLYLVLEAARTLPATEFDDIRASLHPAVRADVDQIVQRALGQQQPMVQRMTAQVYGAYLWTARADGPAADSSRTLALILSPPFQRALHFYVLPESMTSRSPSLTDDVTLYSPDHPIPWRLLPEPRLVAPPPA